MSRSAQVVLLSLLASLGTAAPALAVGDGTFTASDNSPIAAGSTPNAIVVADFNQDSDPDLAVINRDSNDLSLYTGAAGAVLTPAPTNVPLTGSPTGIVTGDFNQDGDPDLAVITAAANGVTILTGGSGATFTAGAPTALGQFPTAIATGDFNRDGDPDLGVTRSNNLLTVLVGGAGTTFTIPPPPAGSGRSAGDGPAALVSADVNADGDPDLVAASSLDGKLTVLLGTNEADFARQMTQPQAGTTSRAIVAANFDGDAGDDPDLAVANFGSDDVSIFSGGIADAFTAASPLTAGDEPSALAVGDFNGDSDPDLAVTNEASPAANGSASIFLGGAGAAFTAATGSPITTAARPLAVAAADFNADTITDLVIASGAEDVLEVLLGNAAPTPPPPPPPGGDDTTPPQTSIDKGPKAKTEKTKAKIAYSANEAATFQCRLKGKGVSSDLRSFTDCGAAKVKYKHLDPGKKKFQVRATDAAGNVDSSPATVKWKVLR